MGNRKKPNSLVKIAAAAVLIVAMSLLNIEMLKAADDDFFLSQQIDVNGTVLGCREADFNGDGKIDLVLLLADPSGRRIMKLYRQRESGRFPPAAGQTIEISSSANMAQSVDLDQDGKAELLIVDRSGLWQYSHDGDQFSENPSMLISTATIFAGGIAGGILEQPFIMTVSGRLVAFLPTAEGYTLWRLNRGNFEKLGDLQVSHLASTFDRPVRLFSERRRSRPNMFVTIIPKIYIGDGNGDSLDDIYLLWPDHLAIFNQKENGGYDNFPSVHFDFHRSMGDNLCQSRLIDLDGDGCLDLVCSISGGGISGAHTDISFYTSNQFLSNDREEKSRISLTDACGNLMLGDFNRSGKSELVVPAIELGILSTVKKMITKKTDFHLLVYPIDNFGHPAKEPAIRKKISCYLNFENADPVSDIRIIWSGDYDGDGIYDLALADGGGQLVFYRGSADEYLESKANLVLDISDPDEIRPTELNIDGRSDLIIIHQPGENSTRLTLLITNRIS